MANRLDGREIPLFWTAEELGPLRSQIESWYSKGTPITSIVKRCLPTRVREGRRPLMYADIYAVLLEAVRRGRLVQRTNCLVDEMPIATFRVFFNVWKDGGSLVECMQKIAVPLPADKLGEQPSPPYTNLDTCKKIHRAMSERWRSEARGHAQALIIKPRKEPLAARPNMMAKLPHDVASRVAQKVYDIVLHALSSGTLTSTSVEDEESVASVAAVTVTASEELSQAIAKASSKATMPAKELAQALSAANRLEPIRASINPLVNKPPVAYDDDSDDDQEAEDIDISSLADEDELDPNVKPKKRRDDDEDEPEEQLPLPPTNESDPFA